MGKRRETDRDRDERVALPLDPETALQALLRVDPDSDPVGDNQQVEGETTDDAKT